MVAIKRYANRKLYNTVAKKYITLAGIAKLIQAGEDVHIIDHETGDDITAVTLAQVMFKHEKEKRGALPRRILAQLIQTGGDTLTSLRRSIPIPFDLAPKVDAEIERRIRTLIEQGYLAEKEGQQLLQKLLSQSQPIETHTPSFDVLWPDPESLAQILNEHGVPSRDEFRELLQQLEALAVEVEQLSNA